MSDLPDRSDDNAMTAAVAWEIVIFRISADSLFQRAPERISFRQTDKQFYLRAPGDLSRQSI
jgi:hypothetical protein